MNDTPLPLPNNSRYAVIALIGKGGVGNVYHAWDTHNNRAVAIKRIPHTLASWQGGVPTEFSLLQRLHYPHLPRVDEIFEDDAAFYIVMEYIPGESLSAVGKRGVTTETAVHYVISLLDTLTNLHSQKPRIIHRDVKPDNLKFHHDGRLMLVDFGIAKAWIPQEQTDVNAKGVTHGYAPPEQYPGGGGTDVRTDVFAAGAVLYFLLTRQSPPHAIPRSYDPTLLRLDPRRVNPMVPAAVAEVVATATHLHQNARYPSAAAMRDALTLAVGSAPTPHVTPPAQVVPQSFLIPARSRLTVPFLYTLGASVLGLLLLLLWVIPTIRGGEVVRGSGTSAATVVATTSPTDSVGEPITEVQGEIVSYATATATPELNVTGANIVLPTLTPALAVSGNGGAVATPTAVPPAATPVPSATNPPAPTAAILAPTATTVPPSPTSSPSPTATPPSYGQLTGTAPSGETLYTTAISFAWIGGGALQAGDEYLVQIRRPGANWLNTGRAVASAGTFDINAASDGQNEGAWEWSVVIARTDGTLLDVTRSAPLSFSVQLTIEEPDQPPDECDPILGC